MRRPLLKLFLTALAAGLAAVTVAVAVVSTGGINEHLRAYAERQATTALGTPVAIGRVTGNPFSRLEVRRLRVGTSEAPFATVRAIQLRYDVWAIWQGVAKVDTLRLVGPQILVRHGQDGQWAVSPPSDREPAVGSVPGARPDTVRATALPLAIEAEWIEVDDGQVVVQAGRSDTLRNLDLAMGFRADRSGYRVALHRFRTLWLTPPLWLSDLSGIALMEDAGLLLQSVQVRTPESGMHVSGTIRDLSSPVFDLHARIDSLSFGELARIAPGSYPPGALAADLRFEGPLSGADLDLSLRLGAATGRIRGRFDLAGAQPEFRLDVEARGVEFTQLMPDLGLDAGFDLAARINGKGLQPEDADIDGELSLTRAHYRQMRIGRLGLRGRLQQGRMSCNADLTADGGRVMVRGDTDLRAGADRFALNLQIPGLDLSRLPQDMAVPVRLAGGLRLQRQTGEVWVASARFDSVAFEGLASRNVVLDGQMRAGAVVLDSLTFGLPFADVRLSGDADLGDAWEPGRGPATYALTAEARGLDLAAGTGQPGLSGSIDLHAVLQGTGLDPETLEAGLALRAHSDDFLGAGIDSAVAVLRQTGPVTQLERLEIVTPLFTARGSGSLTPERADGVTLEAHLSRPAALAALAGIDLGGSAFGVRARVDGPWTVPRLGLEADIDTLRWGEVVLEDIHLKSDALDVTGLTSGRMDLSMGRVRAGAQDIRTLAAWIDVSDGALRFGLENSPDDPFGLSARGRYASGASVLRVELDSLRIRAREVTLAIREPAGFSYTPDGDRILGDLQLQGAYGSLDVKGRPDRPGALRISVTDLDIGRWSRAVDPALDLGGLLNLVADVEGVSDAPTVSARIDLKQGSAAGFTFQSLAGDVGYRAGRVATELDLRQNGRQRVTIRGDLPVRDTTDGEERPIHLVIASEGVDLSFLNLLSSDLRSASGSLALDVYCAGTLTKPEPAGWIRVTDGVLGVRSLNQTFSGIDLDVEFGKDRVALRRFQAQEGKGRLTATGEWTLSGGSGSFAGSLRALDFRPINTPDLSATLSADLRMEGNPDHPRLTGTVELTRVALNIEGLVEGPSDFDPYEIPIVAALEAKLRVSARRNVWIRDSDMNLEMAGDVDVRKELREIRIYGMLYSRRGRYEFQSTRFNIDQAELEFQGKSPPDPGLSVIGTHRMKLVNGERALVSVLVGGTLLYPQVTLESDPPMPMPDILAYLVLGAPSDGGVSSPGLDARAAGLAVGVAASQLKRTVGRRLNLDVVEIDAGASGVERVRIGKYLGDKLYVGYAQGTASAGNEITVEYGLTPQMTLEAMQSTEEESRRQRQSLGVFWKRGW